MGQLYRGRIRSRALACGRIRSRALAPRLVAAAAVSLLALSLPAVASARRPHNGPALTDAAAASMVVHSSWEPRSDNYQANHTVPTASQLRYFRDHDSMPYARYVTGHYRGTTDEIIQWAAHKWNLSVNLMRAVAAVETWWHGSFVGDGGYAFGLYQLDVRYHCCGDLARNSTAFAADYYGAIIRTYYDGLETWLNTVSGNGRPYRAHDLWGSVGYWASGRWHDAGAEAYVQKVKQDEAQQVWRGQWF